MVGIIMYGEIQKLKALGYKKQRAARQLEIDTKTVRKYWDMPEDEYISQQVESRERTKIMDPYRDYVLEKLRIHREITSAIIYANLLEDFEDFEPSYRSVRRYILMLRETEGLPMPSKVRQYMEVAEHPMGFQAQVDLGKKTLKSETGQSVKVYIFAIPLRGTRTSSRWYFRRQGTSMYAFKRNHLRPRHFVRRMTKHLSILADALQRSCTIKTESWW